MCDVMMLSKFMLEYICNLVIALKNIVIPSQIYDICPKKFQYCSDDWGPHCELMRTVSLVFFYMEE